METWEAYLKQNRGEHLSIKLAGEWVDVCRCDMHNWLVLREKDWKRSREAEEDNYSNFISTYFYTPATETEMAFFQLSGVL